MILATAARLLVLTCILTTASAASAQPADPSQLTSRGRVMIGGSIGGYWSNDEVVAPWQLYDSWRIYARPTATFFLEDHIGIGASLGGSASHGKTPVGMVGHWDYARYDFSGGVHAVLEVPIAKNVGWVVLPGVSYTFLKLDLNTYDTLTGNAPGRNIQSQTLRAGAGVDSTAHLVRLSVSLPLLVHLSDSVGIGFGPDAWLDVFIGREPSLLGGYRETRLQLGASSWIAFSF